MNNFKPGGQRNRKEFLGGRPKSDADYGTKKRFDSKPRFESRGGRDDGRGPARYNDRGPKEVQLYSATCTTCGKSCEVPFRPDGTKPVLCRDCFAAKNTSPNSGYERTERFSPKSDERAKESYRPQSTPATPSVDISGLTRQVAALEVKVNQILALLQTKPVVVPVVTAEVKAKVVKEVKPTVAKKVATPKKEATKKVAVKKAVAKKVTKPAAKKVTKK